MIDLNDIGAETGRFTLGEDGQIFWQTNKTNPLPGDLVATIEKGAAPLTPKVAPIFTDAPHEIQGTIESWLHANIREILAPLFTMIDQEAQESQESHENRLEGPALAIGQKIFDAMGVIHRSELEGDIQTLTPEHRTALRRKRVKLGPILVFMPELVKPAAVNMRALLYGLWHGKTLPMGRPADGRVSVTIDPEDVDRQYFRSIGYPIFGAKAIRIDMLDRVITDIYDSSKDWQFQAKHQYMEWLGCGEDDLYAILQSMGFKKQPTADEGQKADDDHAQELARGDHQDAPTSVNPDGTEEITEKITEKTGAEALVETASETETPATEGTDKPCEEPKPQAEKPPLAMFWLKKGKISDRPPSKKYKGDHKAEKKSFSNDKKPFKGKKKKGHDKDRDFKAKNYSAKPKDDEIDNESPFAILQQLKK